MFLPSLAPFPPPDMRKGILPEEWEMCLDSWLLLTHQYLLISSKIFASKVTDDSSVVLFLTSYVDATAHTHEFLTRKLSSLKKNCFLIVHRIYTELQNTPSALLTWEFLSDLSALYATSKGLKSVLANVWHQAKLEETSTMHKSKTSFTSLMETSGSGPQSEIDLFQEMALARMCYPYAQFLMSGSDLLDSMVTAYGRATEPSTREHLVAFLYVSLTSLMNEDGPRTSTLFDHLFSLKSTSLLKALIKTSPFPVKFQRHVSTRGGDSGRARPLLEEFAKYSSGSAQTLSKHSSRHRAKKGKNKAKNDYGHAAMGDVHVHKMSLVTQIQDLFPELGSGFVIRLLDEYNDNTEQITAHLLDDNLPAHLKQADQSEHLKSRSSAHQEGEYDLARDLVPHSTPPMPPIRHNIHDNDDFDNLTIDASKLHIGRKNESLTADRLLSADRPSNQKAAILSALAVFDSNDDERDDTYDAEDVGGTVDNTFADDETDVKGDKNDETLLNVYKITPALFNRDWNTRRSQPRSALKRETGMTDEAIEGWAIMFSRDPKRLKQLERVHTMGTSGPQQPALEGTAWKADSGAEGTDDSDRGGDRGGIRGRGGNRGRGRGGRGAGSVAGPASEHDTQVARQRKDASKGSRANHNRRDQRARKMARGGFPG